MALDLYLDTNENSKMSSDGSGYPAFTVTFDGRIGGSIDTRVYIRNDDLALYYTNITLGPVDTAGDNIVNGSIAGFDWRLAEKDIPMTNEEWALVTPGNTLSLSSDLGEDGLGDISTYLPVWIRVSIPRGSSIQTIKDVVLRIQATENLA